MQILSEILHKIMKKKKKLLSHPKITYIFLYFILKCIFFKNIHIRFVDYLYISNIFHNL